MIKAIIFDCDGTLVDSEHAHYRSWQLAMQSRGSDFCAEDYYPLVGMSAEINAHILAQKIGLEHQQGILEDKRVHYTYLQNQGHPSIVSTVDFVHRLVDEKEKYGLKLGVASASFKEAIMNNLTHLGIDDFFDIILSGSDDLSHYSDPEGVNKPKPYIYLEAAKILGVKPEECVVIEDSRAGVTAGVHAGCITLAVPNAYTETHDFSHAHLTVKSFADYSVESFLKEVNGLIAR